MCTTPIVFLAILLQYLTWQPSSVWNSDPLLPSTLYGCTCVYMFLLHPKSLFRLTKWEHVAGHYATAVCPFAYTRLKTTRAKVKKEKMEITFNHQSLQTWQHASSLTAAGKCDCSDDTTNTGTYDLIYISQWTYYISRTFNISWIHQVK